MKILLRALLVTVCGTACVGLSSTVEAGGCCKRHCSSNCGSDQVVHCCPCGCGKPAAPEPVRRESAPRGRSVGYIVESAPVVSYGLMPMMMPVAFGTPTVPAAGYRRESSETERQCEQLSRDVSKLSEEVDKLIKVVDKQGLALEAIVKKLQEKKLLD